MNYRLATLSDIDNICSLVSDAIKQMENKGIYQWDSLYPTREDFYIDINKKTLYVVEDGHQLRGSQSRYEHEFFSVHHKVDDVSKPQVLIIIEKVCRA